MEDILRQLSVILRSMWLYRWWGLAAAWIVGPIAAAAVYLLPDRYEASARVYVDTQSILKPLMSGLAVQPNVDQQINILSRTLISRPNVEKLIRMADLDLAAKSKEEREALIVAVTKALQIREAGRDNLYTLAYTDTDPQRAKRVVQSMVSIFVESGLGDKRKDSDTARRFIEEQIKAYEQRLIEAENKLKEYKLRNIGTVGSGAPDYFRKMTEATEQLNQARLALREAENSRDALKRQFTGEDSMILPERMTSASLAAVSVPELDASVLKSVLPDLEVLLERPIADAPALSPQAASLRLVHVIESLLLRQTEPLLLLLEDLHWADAESLSLLRRLAPACRQRPILIVASYRDDERPSLPQELPDCPVLKLARLSAAGITELCQSILGPAGCTAELVQFLEAETEGNIFFVIEVMRALAEEAGQLSMVGGERLPKNVLTGGIQAIVHRRLVRLPPEALPLLRLAAVAGRLLDLAVLRRCEPRLEPWLYLAAEAAVLEAVDQTWRFAHDKIRESLLLELGPAER